MEHKTLKYILCFITLFIAIILLLLSQEIFAFISTLSKVIFAIINIIITIISIVLILLPMYILYTYFYALILVDERLFDDYSNPLYFFVHFWYSICSFFIFTILILLLIFFFLNYGPLYLYLKSSL